MIFKGSQRGNAAQLARHLLNLKENEHVELHELRGFSSEGLLDALNEVEAIAKGTRCKQCLFSLSLSPPPDVAVDVATFETAIEMVEMRLGLEGLPRAIVFHEKEGRRHAHAVWSRIDHETMTARNLPWFKTRLNDIAKELFLHHQWEMPKGFIDHALRNPLNFSREEWQQAKRREVDPRMLKAMFRACWPASDNATTLKAALEEKGFFLARGDRRGVVAVDCRGEVYALGRWSGVKEKDVAGRFPKPERLPSVEETKALIATRMTEKLQTYIKEVEATYGRISPSVEFRRVQLVERQRQERKDMARQQEARWQAEERARAARLPRGFSGIWHRITGKYSKIRLQNEVESLKAWQRDRAEKDALISRQLTERHELQKAVQHFRDQRTKDVSEIEKEIGEYLALRRNDLPSLKDFNEKSGAKTPNRSQTRGRDKGFDGPDFSP
jgi:hypothetical protein